MSFVLKHETSQTRLQLNLVSAFTNLSGGDLWPTVNSPRQEASHWISAPVLTQLKTNAQIHRSSSYPTHSEKCDLVTDIVCS